MNIEDNLANNLKLVIELLHYKMKIQNLPNYDELKLNFDIDDEINLISSNLIDFMANDNFSSLPINILYSIFAKYFEQNENRPEISNFLFNYLDKSYKNASILFSLIKFNNIDDLIHFEERLIPKYEDKFDFNYLNSKSIIKTHLLDRQSLKSQLQEKDQEIAQLKKMIKEKDNQLQEKEDLIKQLTQILKSKENYHYFEFDIKDRLKSGIFSFLKLKQNNKQNIFDKDPEFVASLSSADKYSVFSSEENENKNNGLVSCVDAENRDTQHYFTTEFESPQEAELLKIWAFNNNDEYNRLHSFSYKINEEEEIFVPNDKLQMFKDEDVSKRVYCIQLDTKNPIKKITIYPKNDVLNQNSWPIIKRIELYKSINDSKGIIESLIEKREDKDPHRCGVYIYTSIYDLDNFYDVNNNSIIITLGETNPYFKYEITKGYAILTGFRFKKCKWQQKTHYKIIATDNDKKDDEDWTLLYDTDDEKNDDKDLVVYKKFEEYCPPIKFIKLIQKDPVKLEDGKNSTQLEFNHIEFFGHLLITS